MGNSEHRIMIAGNNVSAQQCSCFAPVDKALCLWDHNDIYQHFHFKTANKHISRLLWTPPDIAKIKVHKYAKVCVIM